MTGPLCLLFLFCGGLPVLWIGIGIARCLEPINAPWQAWQAQIAWEDSSR